MEQWHFLVNQIDNVTKESNVLGIRISNTHDGKLFGNITDPFISGLYDNYHPFHLDYVKANANYTAQIKIQTGLTKDFTALLTKLGFEDINAIDSAIQIVYNITTTKYSTLLGKGHAPFQNGPQEERIAAVLALSVTMAGDLLLATVKDMVDKIYDILSKADTAQKGAFSTVENAGNALETARKNMADEQFGDIGSMMQEYRKDPSKAAVYYDLQAIRNFNQTFFQRKINKKASKFVVERTVDNAAQMTIANIGVTTLRFYLSDKNTGEIGTVYQELVAGDEKTIFINTLGDVTLLHFFMAQNMDAVNKGEFTLEFL